MADLIITLIFYAFCLAGSVTTGYVLLRLTYPDIRTMDHNQKLGASAGTGAALLILTIITSTIIYGVDAILDLTTPLFLITAVIFTIVFGSLKIYSIINPQKFVTVALPIPQNSTRSATSKPLSIIASVEAQTAPKSQLEKLARSATEGSTIIDVPIKREDTTPQQLPSFEMIVPNKGDAPIISTQRTDKKVENKKENTRNTSDEYTSMASPDTTTSEPWWRRKRDSTVATTSQASQTSKKEEKITQPIKTPTPAVAGDWRRPRDGTTSKVATGNVDEVDAILADVVKETKVKATTQTQQGGPVHRRYLLGKDSIAVVAPAGTKDTPEFNAMVQDVYSQLKTAKSTSAVTPVQTTEVKTDAKKEDKKPAAKTTSATPPTAKTGDLSIQDILGGSTTQETPAATGVFAQLDAANPGEGNSLFGQLSEISGGKSTSAKVAATAPAKQADVQNVKIAAEKDMACPTCRAKNTRIVFCPYCGSGMCANCSPQIKPVGPGQFLYTCPKCQEQIQVKTR